MNENEKQQNEVTDLLLIEHGLRLLQEKLNGELKAVENSRETETAKTFLNESYTANLNRTTKLLKETTNKILNI